MINTISATELKNKLSEVLNLVYYNKAVFIVKKHNKAIAKIVPIEKPTKISKKEI